MKRRWWIQAVVYACLLGGAVVVLLPSLLPDDQLPALLRHHARRMRPSVDVQGGIRLAYDVEVDEVVAARRAALGRELSATEADELAERAMRNALWRIGGRFDKIDSQAEVTREGHRIVVELPGLRMAEAPRIRSIIERP